MLIMLTLKETADLTGLSCEYVKRLVGQHKFPQPIKLPCPRKRFHFIQADVVAWLVTREIKQVGKKKRGRPVKSRGEPAGRRRGWPNIARRNPIETEGAGS